MTKVFDFNEQLKIGTRAEKFFMSHYPKKIKLHPGHDGDFIEESSGCKIELKSDNYDLKKTPNFFFERWSSYYSTPKKVGGPWQAYEHECDIFCYYFVNNSTWFQFNDMEALLSRLNTLTSNKGLVYIKNRSWTTAGYKVPRKDLEDLYDIWEF